MQFVALDLETTGLNPAKDTIIEIAAIKCILVQKDGNFCIENAEEKTMLIDPEIPLEPEVSLITGISPQMLAGKKKWEEVREKVADFIGDLPIVGHNILFDKAVLEAHNIDISNNIFLDTFEIASIVSRDAESLNLGFLANHYCIKKRGAEHRALTDTWISVDLFCLYLTQIHHWQQAEKQLWNTAMKLTEDPSLTKIATITGILIDNKEKIKLQEFSERKSTESEKVKFHTNHTFHTYDILYPNKQSERDFFESKGQITLITRNTNDAKNIQKRLGEYGISNLLFPAKNEYISYLALQEIIDSNQKYSRKMAVLIARLLFWRYTYQSESLDGFRTYGKERSLLPQFRLRDDESCNEYEALQKQSKNVQVTLMNAHTFANSDIESYETLIFKDATLIEGILRQAFSVYISFSVLFENIDICKSSPLLDAIQECIEVIEDMYLQTANRPTGENPFPPGAFGETYVIEQKTLWKKMCKSLALWTQKLWEHTQEWNKTYHPQSRSETFAKQDIIKSISALHHYHTMGQPNILTLISIKETHTTLRYISNTLDTILPRKGGEYLDFSRGNTSGNAYIQTNYHTTHLQEHTHTTPIITQGDYRKIQSQKTVILTTSLRHIREIHEALSPQHNHTFFVQGISGGKAKMLHNFKQESSAILIGLIESWRDMSTLWQEADVLYIAKVPFDPPSDPYFLVKTKSMSNNFDAYSIPMVIARVNTLVGNAVLMNPNLKVICSDKRLIQSKWGKSVAQNLL